MLIHLHIRSKMLLMFLNRYPIIKKKMIAQIKFLFIPALIVYRSTCNNKERGSRCCFCYYFRRRQTIKLFLWLLFLVIIFTLCTVPVSGSMKNFSCLPVEFFTANSIHFFHRRSGILFRTQNQTKAFSVTVPPLIAVHLGPQ